MPSTECETTNVNVQLKINKKIVYILISSMAQRGRRERASTASKELGERERPLGERVSIKRMGRENEGRD